MQRQMSKEELDNYIYKIKNISNDFKKFLQDYVIGDTFIRGRGEEDVTVWKKLKGDELEAAKNIIINELNIIPDTSYIRAVGYFRDERAIPVLEKMIANLPEEYLFEKLEVGKVLYEWKVCEKYLYMLEKACEESKGSTLDYLKVSIDWFTFILEPEQRNHLLKILNSNI